MEAKYYRTQLSDHLDFIEFIISTQFIEPMNKAIDVLAKVTQSLLETLNNLYQLDHFKHIYIDGSRLEEETRASIFATISLTTLH